LAAAAAAAALLRRLSTHDECRISARDTPPGPEQLQAALQAAVDAHRNAVAALMDRVMAAAMTATSAAVPPGGSADPPPPRFSPILLPHVIRDALEEEEEAAMEDGVCGGDGLSELLALLTEAVVRPPILALALRPGVGLAVYLSLDAGTLRVSRLAVSDYLAVMEAVAGVPLSLAEQVLGTVEVDLQPFWPASLPSCPCPNSIGQGVDVINRHLCARLMECGGGGGGGKGGSGLSKGAAALHAFLSDLALGGSPLGLLPGGAPGALAGPADLAPAVQAALGALQGVPAATPWEEVGPRLAALGFARGWGDTAGRAAATLALLRDALAAPHPAALEGLLARLPGRAGGHAVVMVSPHGFFAQSGALGKPDTGGQVVYVCDAVRALEKELLQRAADAGLGRGAPPPRIVILTRLIPDAQGTTCNVRRERVEGTAHAVILRVPFRDGGGVVPGWVSRFKVWPYLETFAMDAGAELKAELGGAPPDLIIGHYTDGGLVAGLLARAFGPRTTLAHVAHALEKNKYPQAGLRWAQAELRDYNFG